MTEPDSPAPWIDRDSEDCTHPIILIDEGDAARIMTRADYAHAAHCVNHHAELLNDNAALRVENERQAALITELADALRNLLHDTAHGVFARGPSATRQAEAALEKVRKP